MAGLEIFKKTMVKPGKVICYSQKADNHHLPLSCHI